VRSHCPLCRARKGKRACPAKGEAICAPCCGSKRRVQIDCPEDCVYLTGAHAPAWSGRETEHRRDVRLFAPHLLALEEGQVGLFFVTLSRLGTLCGDRPDLTDQVLLSALEALRRTVETREKGVLYEHPASDLRAAGLTHELAELFEAPMPDTDQRVAPADHDLAAVLGALEGALRDAQRQVSAGPTAFLAAVARLADHLGAADESPRKPARALIVEP
jgi:hypothetical protein